MEMGVKINTSPLK